MTSTRAAIIKLMERYQSTGYDYRLALVEVHKLAYFLQESDVPLGLDFVPHHYGSYADNLRKTLRNIEGHFTSGIGAGDNSPETPLTLLPGAAQEASDFLSSQTDVTQGVERVARLIAGFESPFGMELFGTVHWVAHASSASSPEAVVAGVHDWSPRKKAMMKPGHINAALGRLQAERRVG